MKILLLLMISLLPYTLFSQLNSKNNVLTEKNGFRDIKLGSNVNKYPFLIKSKSDWDFSWYYNGRSLSFSHYDVNYFADIKSANYDKIGSTKIQKLFVATHEDIIYKILLITDYNTSVFDNLKLMFGEDEMGIGYSRGPKFKGFWTGNDIFMMVTSGDADYHDYCSIVYIKPSIVDLVEKEAKLRREKNINEQNEKIKKDF